MNPLPPMTPTMLQQGLIEELRELLPEFTLYEQFVPRRKEKGELLPCPYIQVALSEGEDAEDATQDVVLIIGVRDEAADRQGYRDVLNAIEKIRQKYKKHSCVKEQAQVISVGWTPPDDDSHHPYYFGAVLLTVQIPQMELVSDYT